jgi:hypothetical protein
MSTWLSNVCEEFDNNHSDKYWSEVGFDVESEASSRLDFSNVLFYLLFESEEFCLSPFIDYATGLDKHSNYKRHAKDFVDELTSE